MAIKVITTYICDVCSLESEKNCMNKMQVIFFTEQTEGRATKPYISNVDICVCIDCMAIVLKGNYIKAHGAMGYNKYDLEDVNKR